MPKKFYEIDLWCPGSTMVQHSTPNPNTEGLNLAIGNGKEKIVKYV